MNISAKSRLTADDQPFAGTLTPHEVAKTKRYWEHISKEPLEISGNHGVSGPIYAYGSELACLRLEHAFRPYQPKGAHAGYSENLKTWYFVNK